MFLETVFVIVDAVPGLGLGHTSRLFNETPEESLHRRYSVQEVRDSHPDRTWQDLYTNQQWVRIQPRGYNKGEASAKAIGKCLANVPSLAGTM